MRWRNHLSKRLTAPPVENIGQILDKLANLSHNGGYYLFRTRLTFMKFTHTARISSPKYIIMDMMAMAMRGQLQAAAVEDRA